MPRKPRTRHLEPAPWLVCPVCGMGMFTAPAVGRPRRTCSDACRQEAYRRRLDTTPKPLKPASPPDRSGRR